ncbi:MAG: hypothetical protein JWQ97_3898, partial [Phenylobacterium sp.]|nr:hypothetical protein [Phenylobacterium sp.]
ARTRPATPAPAPAPSAALAAPSADQVPIAVTPPPPETAAPRALGRLEVLPPEMAQAARMSVRPPATPAPPQIASLTPVPEVAPARPAPTAPAPVVSPPEPAVADGPALTPAAPPAPRASFDCATARPGAEEAVCSDAGLAAADRQLARAYRRAMRSGVDPADLRQEQRDWMAIREDAAHRSRHALASVYDQRIAELDEMAASAPPPDDGQ